MLETIWESRWLPDLYGGVAQLGEHLPCKQGVMSSNLTISTRIHGFESAKFTWMITYLDNFTLIKIIKETYVDLIVTDIRFYRMIENI